MIVVKQDLIDTIPKCCINCPFSESEHFKAGIYCKLLNFDYDRKYYLQDEYCECDYENRPEECPLIEV